MKPASEIAEEKRWRLHWHPVMSDSSGIPTDCYWRGVHHNPKCEMREHVEVVRASDYNALAAKCRAMEAALRQCVNRLRNQGGDISEITYNLNMLAAGNAENVLALAAADTEKGKP